MNEFYYRYWLVRKKVALDAVVTKVFVQRIHPGRRTSHCRCRSHGWESWRGIRRATWEGCLLALDFAIVVGWKVIKAIFPWAIGSYLLKLVHSANGFPMLPDLEPLKK
ncbi:hypothetical protein B9Z19DRAFT_1168369, partial [Tuber borchii]